MMVCLMNKTPAIPDRYVPITSLRYNCINDPSSKVEQTLLLLIAVGLLLCVSETMFGVSDV